MTAPTTEELLRRIETLESRPRARTRRRSARAALGVIVLASLLAVPIGVFAGHSFTDVPTSHTFHDQISQLKEAGVAVGCSATKYCPATSITRGEMAAFVTRGAGRVAQRLSAEDGDNPPVQITPAAGGGVIGSITIVVPGVAGKQFVLVTGRATIFTDQDGMDCTGGCPYSLWLGEPGGASMSVWATDDGFERINDHQKQTAQTEMMFIATSGTHTYSMRIAGEFPETVFVRPWVMIAQTIPFGWDGGAPPSE